MFGFLFSLSCMWLGKDIFSSFCLVQSRWILQETFSTCQMSRITRTLQSSSPALAFVVNFRGQASPGTVQVFAAVGPHGGSVGQQMFCLNSQTVSTSSFTSSFTIHLVENKSVPFHSAQFPPGDQTFPSLSSSLKAFICLPSISQQQDHPADSTKGSCR